MTPKKKELKVNYINRTVGSLTISRRLEISWMEKGKPANRHIFVSIKTHVEPQTCQVRYKDAELRNIAGRNYYNVPIPDPNPNN